MKKYFKRLIAVGFTLVLLCLAAIVVVTVVIDPNEYKENVAKLVREKTGREVSFEGDIELEFFPYIGFGVGPVAMGNAPGFKDPEMIRINRAEISLRLLPLLSGKLVVGNVILDGLSVHLIKDSRGTTNWQDIAGGGEATPQAASSNGSTAEDTGNGLHFEDISIQGVEVTNANLVYTDEQNRSETSLSNLDLILGAIHGTKSFPFELGFDLVSDQPKLDIRPTLSGEVRLDPTAGTIAMDYLVLTAPGMRAAGQIQASTRDEKTTFSGTLRLAETSLREVLDKLGLACPETSDPSVLQRFSATLRFAGTDDSVDVQLLTVKLDDTTLSAHAEVDHFAAPRIGVAARVDSIDMDRYLPPRRKSEPNDSEAPSTASSPSAAQQEPDLSALRHLALNARLDVQRLKVMNITAQNIRLEASAHDGVLTLSPLSLHLDEGLFEGRARLDATGRIPVWSAKGALQNLKLRPLLHDLLGKDVLSGVASADYELGGSGLTPENMKKSVCGDVSFAVRNGSVIGLDVAGMIRNGWNTLMGTDEQGTATDDFAFSSLTASALLQNGHLVNDDLAFDSPLVKASGAGWADLPENTTDYKAMVTVVGSLDGLEGEILETIRDAPLPLRVQGALDQPSIGLNMEAMAETFVAAGVETGLDILTDSLLESLDEESSAEKVSADAPDEYSDEDGAFDLLDDLF